MKVQNIKVGEIYDNSEIIIDMIYKENTSELINQEIQIAKDELKFEDYVNISYSNKILDENENLIWVLEGDIKDRTLSNDECFDLSKLVKIHYDIHSIEEKEIFFLGGKEAYFFFKKLGILA